MALISTLKNGRAYFRNPNADNARGGFLAMAPDNFGLKCVPFLTRGDEQDSFELVPVLHSPVDKVVGPPFDYEWQLVDGTKITASEALPSGFFDGEPGLVYTYKRPVSTLFDRGDGKCVVKTLQVMGNVTPTLQLPLTPAQIAEGHIRGEDINYSLVFSSDKRNNINYSDGTKTHAMTGKAGHARRPEFINLTIGGLEISRCWGEWEVRYEDDLIFIDKVVDFSLLEGFFVETSATLGYTSIGATVDSNYDHVVFELGAIPDNATLTELAWYNLDGVGSFIGVYNDSGANEPTSLVTGSDTPAYIITNPAGWATYSHLTTPALVKDARYWIGTSRRATSGTVNVYYDSVAGYGWRQGFGTSYVAARDPYSNFGAYQVDQQMSGYITYSAAAPSAGGTYGKLNIGLGIGI